MAQKRFFLIVTALLTQLLAGAAIAASDSSVKTLWLDTLDISKMDAAWGTPQVNRSVDMNPLSIGGKRFERGIGTHADSIFMIALDGKATRFTAFVGVNDEVVAGQQIVRGSIEFKVVGDNKNLWSSGVMRGKDPAKECSVDITGIKALTLMVDQGDENSYDHADWAMAKIEYTGDTPVAKDIPRPEPYILTPKPGPKPRITGPKVFGVRPGNPFLFTVTATGRRPMKFEIKGLPQGLTLDSATGRITGTLKERGEFKTTVTASNALGSATREFRIVVGDTICLTPPMGWNSWNCWACSVDDAKVRAAAKAMVDSGLIDHGWSYINIDDCWMRKQGDSNPAIGDPVRDSEGYLISNAKFPDMKKLTDYIHDLGLKAGTYISPGPTTCQGYVGSWQFEKQDAVQFAEWGFDYLKYDWCGYSSVSDNKTLEDLQRPYILMRKMLDLVDRDIVYSLCQYGWGDVWKWGQEVGGNCWRTTGDITDSWSSMAGIGFAQADHAQYANPGHWNDPDMLVVGKVGWGPNLHPSRLTPDEQYTHISLWCLLSSPLLIGCPVDNLDDFTANLLTNDEVLDINQDPLGRQARRISNEAGKQVWVKELEDGSIAVGLFNTQNITQTVSVSWKDINRTGKRNVRDLWRQQNEGQCEGTYSAEIPIHGVKLIRID